MEARSCDGLWQRIGELLDCFTPDECANYFARPATPTHSENALAEVGRMQASVRMSVEGAAPASSDLFPSGGSAPGPDVKRPLQRKGLDA
jgi:hypothetical protein